MYNFYQKILINNLMRISPRQIITVPNTTGYGNQMYSIITAFVIAILDNRKLRIHWPDLVNIIEEPIEQNTYIYNSYLIPDLTYNVVKLRFKSNQSWLMKKDANKVIQTKVDYETPLLIHADGSLAYFFEICSNPKYFNKLLELNLVSQKTIQNAMIALDSDKEKFGYNNYLIDSLYKIGFEVGGTFLNNHWKPKPVWQAKIDSILASEFDDNFVIGLQIRTFFLNSTNDIDNFIKCAHNLETTFNKSGNKKNVKWYVSSDDDNLNKKLKVLFPNKVIFGPGLVSHIIHNKNGFPRAIIDIELLSRTDILITTGGSTFGFIASIKSQRFNYVINSGEMCEKITMSKPGHVFGTNVI